MVELPASVSVPPALTVKVSPPASDSVLASAAPLILTSKPLIVTSSPDVGNASVDQLVMVFQEKSPESLSKKIPLETPNRRSSEAAA